MSRARTLADQFNSDGDLALTPVASVNAGQIGGRRNLIINGAMTVAQRATSVTGISSNAYHTMDRFKWLQQGSTTWNMSQSTVSPDGFAYSNKIEVNNAVASPSAGDFAVLSYSFEGQDLQHLDWGTANAKSITLSFWVRSSITGKFYAELDQTSTSRNSISYTINAADTWEYKTLSYIGDTSVGPDNDNSAELSIYFWFLAGSTYAGGTTTENVWHTVNADRAVGQTNLAASTGDVVYLTGIQLEVGSQASDFEHRSYGEELLLCKRYYQYRGGDTPYQNITTVTNFTGGHMVGPLYHEVELRAIPTITKSGNWATLGGNTTVGQTVSADQNGTKSVQMGFNNGSGGTSGYSATLRVSNDSNFRLTFDAEL